MEKKRFKVCIKDDSNKYINGRISGMVAALSDENDRVFANTKLDDNSTVLEVRLETSEENWAKMQKVIERNYPGLCDFV